MSGIASLRPDLAVIAEQIAPGTRVLDIGCGNGDLMEVLETHKECDARGMELNPEKVERCVARGLSVVQGDANSDLANYPDKAFDYTILSQTLQTAQRPDRMLEELLRVGRQAFVSFPNFAHWRTRTALLFGGKMPVTTALPVSWYATENIHHVTVEDFRELAKAKGAQIEQAWFLANDKQIARAGANWRAQYAVFQLTCPDT
ncbi:MAG: methionine biosynthesis protein MetW [Pseudomonadota bacterium]